MMKHKLSNVVLKVEEHTANYPKIYYRAHGNACFDAEKAALSFSGRIDFLTYFNACSVAKWHKYANVQKVSLRLVLSGDVCMLQFVGASEKDDKPCALAPGQRLTGGVSSGDIPGAFVYDIEAPATDKQLLGFVLSTPGAVFLHEAYYYTEVDECSINPVRLALSTTTYKKEAYIVPNIELVKREVLESSDPIADAFHMFVVDNGQTLDVAVLSDEGVTVIPNRNAGGAGGFARGMMEALASDAGYTHILLMDDDVKVSPESLKRTFNLLSLAQGRYKNAYINGAMLAMEKPNLQFEDVAHVVKSGAYQRIKEDLHIDELHDIAVNESVNVEIPNAYGAWWYSCIPLNAVRANGLPVPVFVRCDDVEFGMRNKPTYMSMNGICVWHEAFEGRFRPSVDCYQFIRNFMVMIALDDCASEKMFVRRWERKIHVYMRTMEYNTVELLIKGMEDYLKGPKFLMESDGALLMKENSAMNEKLRPVEELDQEMIASLKYNSRALGGKSRIRPFLMLWRTLPYDRHMLPDAFLRDKPEAAFYSGLSVLAPRTMATKTLVALDLEGKNASVRHMDRARYEELMARYAEVKKDYAKCGAEVRAAYKEAKPKLTSWEFWNEYLGTDLHPSK